MAQDTHGDVMTPFVDQQGTINDKNSSSNVSLVDGDPGYKKATPSPNIPSRTSRHTNMDGGADPGIPGQRPDAVKKRVS